MRKSKNIWLLGMTIIMTILMVLGAVPSTYAAIADTPVRYGIVSVRPNSGYGYMINGLGKVWKIAEFNSDLVNPQPKNFDKSIYCLKQGLGFGNTTGSNIDPVYYDVYFDMKTEQGTMAENYRNMLPEDGIDGASSTYNKVLWILDNGYIPQAGSENVEENTQRKERLLKKVFKEELEDETMYPPFTMNDILLTEDDIDVVQQLAIWHFTNPENTYLQNSFTLFVSDKENAQPNEYQALSDLFGEDGDTRNDQAVKLFNYYIEQANQNAAYYGTGSQREDSRRPLELVKSNIAVEETDSNFILGPYRIEEITEKEYELTTSFTADEEAFTDYTLLDSNQQPTGESIEQMVGRNFYIAVPKTTEVTKVTFHMNVKYYQNKVTYWTTGTNPEGTQPIVVVEPEEKIYSDSIDVIIQRPEKVFDLALRKFITKVNEVTVNPIREPVISAEEVSKLAEGTTTTVEKVHPKDPILVKTGDKVLYTIRIYNEGEVGGYAKKITDHLPEGLKFIPAEESTINRENGWSNPTGDGRTIETAKLADVLIPAFHTDPNRISSVDIQIECEVTAQVSDTDVNLKNVAQISEHADENGNTDVIDIDSRPGNADVPGYGLTSQEDDDDFELLRLQGKEFDLSLRKFITSVNNKELKEETGTYIREPKVDISKLNTIDSNGRKITTAIYEHPKAPVAVRVGDIVVYTIRVYNEGEAAGYAAEVTDHLPAELEFIINDELNAANGWILEEADEELRTIKTNKLSKENDEENIIEGFDGTTLHYKELQVKCRVKQVEEIGKKITNIADITKFTDENGKEVLDRDSTKDNVILPDDTTLPNYKDDEIAKEYVPGQEDDDDFEKVKLEVFDLSLRKFITKINDANITSRIPQVDSSKLYTMVNGTYVTTATYTHPKDPILVSTDDTVIYTIRVYNEGDVSGYAEKVIDDIPEGLVFLPEHEVNKAFGWKLLKEDGTETTEVEEAKKIETEYLSKGKEQTAGENLIIGFDKATMEEPAYKEVKVAFKVVEPNTSDKIIINTAEIGEDADENGEPVEDIDSTPGNEKPEEDDIDIEKLKVTYFDLALRKFITKIGEEEITTRIPEVNVEEDGTITYTHPKDPISVVTEEEVTYTLRIYNEGNRDGYAKEIKDDIPEGLEFLPDNEVNKEYGWKMLKEDGTEATKVEEATQIRTEYLSKEKEQTAGENLLIGFDKTTMKEPAYKDIKVVFKVVEPSTSDRIVINTAEISEDTDKDGNDVIDKDSIPDNDKEGEDDIDIEKVKVKYFDLSLRKWVTQAIVIENGKETITNTGHTAEQDPEPIVKVDLYRKDIQKVTVKFRYSIRIKNEGEIAGYAKEVADYVPQGLKFVQEDNPKWEQREGNRVVTDQLKDTLLQPGESTTVEIVLTWINEEENMTVMTNIAEIHKDGNDSNTPDIDSTPGNEKPGEDDIDDAPVIITVSTGRAPMYITLTATILIMLAGGIFLIKKYVL